MILRHEYKHVISKADAMALTLRLRSVLQRDPYHPDGPYRIRSLYFDNYRDKALMEKIGGVDHREKFRLRYYGRNLSYVVLEKKSKHHDLCAKEQTQLSKQEIALLLEAATAKALPDKNGLELLADSKPLLTELLWKTKTQLLRPKVVVDYERDAFIYAPGNVRITLDSHIRTGLKNEDFLDPDSVTVAVSEDPIILEIKWDAYLPDFIKDLVQVEDSHTQAYSKYCAARMFD